MCHGRKSTYLVLAIAVIALALAFDINPTWLIVFAVCPLMMFFMMRTMDHGGHREDHTGHGCEHDPTRQDQRAKR